MTNISAANEQLMRVASPRVRNNATTLQIPATTLATGAQQPSLKALALLALARNNMHNNDAQAASKATQQTDISIDTFVALVSSRNSLLRLASDEQTDRALIDRLADADVSACAGLSDDILRTYARALVDTALRENGERPADETEAALCRHCGPIWIASAIADVAPTVRGMPTVAGCPWCHVKNRENISRPQVICGSCQHFARDTVNVRDGAGNCMAGCDPDRPYPRVKRTCGAWRPLTTDQRRSICKT